MINSETKSKAFTLVEIIVSIAITGILMIGISTFFSSTFNTVFRVQNESVKTEKQFVVNEIIRDKFTKVKEVVNTFSGNPKYSNEALLLNKTDGHTLPFSYIGKSGSRLAFKDFLVFNKMTVSQSKHLYANSGEGKIDISSGSIINPLIPTTSFKNFSSFAINGTRYYIALPYQNKILDCDCSSGKCDAGNPSLCKALPTTALDSPTDVELDDTGDYLFISDSGNGRVIRYKLTIPDQGEEVTIASPLKYPTGLSFYDDGTDKWLFIADTLGNKVLKVNAYNPTSLITVAGAGTDKTCSSVSSKFCQLSLPTGLFADSINKPDSLYIADSGNDRILQVSDPGIPDSLTFEFTPGENYKLDRIKIEGANFAGGKYNNTKSNLIGDSGNYTNTTNTFLNPARLTVYSNSTVREETTPSTCETDIASNSFYVNEFPQSLGFENGDKIFYQNTAFTISSYSLNAIECRLSKADPTLPKYKVIVAESIAATPPANSEIIYPGTPDTIKVQIDNDAGSPITANPGFQTLSLKVYDIDQGLVHTEKTSLRIGDDIVGTEEDLITEKVSPSNSIHFPTGVTSNFFANSGKGTINYIATGAAVPNKTISQIDTNAFAQYDYTSDFDLIGKLDFNLFNSDTILELRLTAKVDDQKNQPYVINAALGN